MSAIGEAKAAMANPSPPLIPIEIDITVGAMSCGSILLRTTADAIPSSAMLATTMCTASATA